MTSPTEALPMQLPGALRPTVYCPAMRAATCFAVMETGDERTSRGEDRA